MQLLFSLRISTRIIPLGRYSKVVFTSTAIQDELNNVHGPVKVMLPLDQDRYLKPDIISALRGLQHIQWNLFIMDTLGPAISGSFLLLYRGFPLSEVKMY